MNHLTISAEFSGHSFTVYEINGRRWIQALDVGRALGYSHPEDVMKVYRRHADEFGVEDTCTANLAVQGQNRLVRLFSAAGCAMLSMWANTKPAKDFRVWAKKVLAVAMETPAPVATAVPAAVTVEGRLGNIEQSMSRLANTMDYMASNMGQLVQVSLQQATKHQVLERYVGLLELNQRGTVKVTAEIKLEILTLYTQGMPQRDIARLTRISYPTVNQIVKGKYPENALTKANPAPEDLVQAALDRNLQEERERIALLQQGALTATGPAAQS